jgi:hypothetical protein
MKQLPQAHAFLGTFHSQLKRIISIAVVPSCTNAVLFERPETVFSAFLRFLNLDQQRDAILTAYRDKVKKLTGS